MIKVQKKFYEKSGMRGLFFLLSFVKFFQSHQRNVNLPFFLRLLSNDSSSTHICLHLQLLQTHSQTFPITHPFSNLSYHPSILKPFLSPIHSQTFPIIHPFSNLSYHPSILKPFLSLIHSQTFPITHPFSNLSYHPSILQPFLSHIHSQTFPIIHPFFNLSYHPSILQPFTLTKDTEWTPHELQSAINAIKALPAAG